VAIPQCESSTIGSSPGNAASRLNPAQAALEHIDDLDVADSLAFLIEHTREALKNLEGVAARESRA
jgi:hypothetical protein